MQTPDNAAGRATERVMAAIRRAGVLKPDEPNRPTHYNAAYSAVYDALSEPDQPPIFEPLHGRRDRYDTGGRR